RRKTLGPDHPLVAEALNNWAGLLTKQPGTACSTGEVRRGGTVILQHVRPDGCL
ncbi:unnamed protein product, partial [Ectocarpus sp. 12 AP-2014]